ncbi:MAG TPA: glycosyltransferase family 4 protein [Bacteroidota bacterium]|nr:glycosyltransferase family 4 protein [Bacteroidota bacterium]
MNILLLNHYAGSQTYGMEFRPHSFAREWVKAGHSVRIVAASFSHLRHQQPVTTGTITTEAIDGIQYYWIKTPAYKGNHLQRALNIFSFVVKLMLHRKTILSDFTPDIVIGSSTYPLDNIVAHQIARQFKATHVYEVHDLWPLSLTDLSGMSAHHPFVLLMQWAEHYAYKTVDAVISLLPYAETHMRAHGLALNKFYCVPNGIDISDPVGDASEIPVLHRQVLNRLRERNAFIVGYAGGHAISNALDTFVKSAIHLTRNDAALVLVGTGTEKERLMRRAKHLSLSNVYFLPPVPRRSVQPLLRSMDALFIGWQNKPIYRYGVSPNKLMDYMLSGKPIIHANKVGNDIVAECGCGISVAPENSYAIARAIRSLMKMSVEARDEMGRKGSASIQRHYQNKDLALKYIDLCTISIGRLTSIQKGERSTHVVHFETQS